MSPSEEEEKRRRVGLAISIASIVCAAAAGLLVLRQIEVNPRTDDAEVFANFIGIATFRTTNW
jgi:multidrug efflux system membrane fusion protein